MTNQNNSHSSDVASSGNSSLHRKFPESGSYDVNEWAIIWNVNPDKIREWIRKYNIPVWGPSQKCFFVEAIDFRAAFEKRDL